MAKDRNGKEIEVGDEIVLVLRVAEIVPRDGDVAVLRAVGVHGKVKDAFDVFVENDQIIVQRKANAIKPRGCGVRGCGIQAPHAHEPLPVDPPAVLRLS